MTEPVRTLPDALPEVFETGSFEVRALDFQRWAAAVGEDNPLYFDPEYARRHGHRDVVMPPLFLGRGHGVVNRLDALGADGIPQSMEPPVELPPRRMAGGEEWTFERDVYPGEQISWRRELTGLEEKRGRLGEFVVMTWTTRYTAGPDDPVAVSRHKLLALPKEVDRG